MGRRDSDLESIMDANRRRSSNGQLKADEFYAELGRMTKLPKQTIKDVLKGATDLMVEELYWYSKVELPGVATMTLTERKAPRPKHVTPEMDLNEDGSYDTYSVNSRTSNSIKVFAKMMRQYGDDLPMVSRNNWRDVVNVYRTAIGENVSWRTAFFHAEAGRIAAVLEGGITAGYEPLREKALKKWKVHQSRDTSTDSLMDEFLGG